MTNPNESAFARISDDYIPEQWGLTKREYFAAMAMQGLANNWHRNDQDRQECANRAVLIADELIKALNQQ